MPVPFAPYPPQPYLPMQPSAGSQTQVICSGCRTLLLYPQGATNVRCALCNYVTPIPPHGSDMAQLVCGGCHTLLMHLRGATSVQCSWCHTVNFTMDAMNQLAYVNCGGCNTTLSYAYGAQSVRCALCQFVTAIPMSSMNSPFSTQRPPFVPLSQSPISMPSPRPQTQTVVVENPMTLDESGKLVSNVAVGVTEKT